MHYWDDVSLAALHGKMAARNLEERRASCYFTGRQKESKKRGCSSNQWLTTISTVHYKAYFFVFIALYFSPESSELSSGQVSNNKIRVSFTWLASCLVVPLTPSHVASFTEMILIIFQHVSNALSNRFLRRILLQTWKKITVVISCGSARFYGSPWAWPWDKQ